MTTKATQDSVDQVLAARQTLRRRFELAFGERAPLRADERTPPDRERDAHDYERDNYENRDACKFLPAAKRHCLNSPVGSKVDFVELTTDADGRLFMSGKREKSTGWWCQKPARKQGLRWCSSIGQNGRGLLGH